MNYSAEMQEMAARDLRHEINLLMEDLQRLTTHLHRLEQQLQALIEEAT